MILILGQLADSGIALLVHRLLERKIPFLILDPREHGNGFEMTWEMEGERSAGYLRHGRETTSLDEVTAVYVHLLRAPNKQESAGRYHFADTSAMLHWFLETTPIPVCNRPSCSATNFSKTYQQQIIAANGFPVPRTLVTNRPDEARDFFEQCRGRVIYKSLSSIRSIVRRMTSCDLDRLDLLTAGPTQFQQWLPGTDVRVHVMGTRVYPTAITTQAIDYRFSNLEAAPLTMRGVALPDEVAQRCVKLTAALGLMSSGVDLRHGLDMRWYCLEANPTPAFAFYEQFTGQRIADGLIDTLLESAEAARGRGQEADRSDNEEALCQSNASL